MPKPTLAASCVLLLSLVSLILCACEVSAATCGDGLQEEGEQCEDGNQVAEDGCSEMCQCETDPCDFAASPSVNLASVVLALRPGATLSLAAGTYTGSGSCGWSIATTSADDRSLPITVRGAQGATIIDCDNVGPVVEDTILGAHLRLEGIHFTQSQRSGGSGGVLRAEQGSEIVIDNCRFTHCACDGFGGAIYVSNSSISVVRSHFEENSAEDSGGSLAASDGSIASLADSTIARCFAGHGGGVYVEQSKIVMRGMLFSQNAALVNKGGAALAHDNSEMNVTSTTVTDNVATRGGGFMAQFSSVLRLTGDVRVVKCVARLYGGAGYGLVDSTIDLSGAILVDDNFAGSISGAFHNFFSRRFIASGEVSLTNNAVPGGIARAGALYATGGTVVELYDGVKVSSNIAGKSGAGIGVERPGSVLFATGVIFDNNHVLGFNSDGSPDVRSGGGALYNEEGASVFVYRSVLRNSSAYQGGGLLDLGNDPRSGSVVVEDSLFANNVAYGGDGGGAYFFGRPTRVTRVVFSNNTASFGSGGGAVFGSGTPATFHDCTFVGNVAFKGGALSGNGQGAIVQVVSTTFRRNFAFLEGGGIFVTGAAALTLNNSKIVNGKTDGDGGGMSTRGQTVVTLVGNVVISDCESKGMGGGVLVAGADLTVASNVGTSLVVANNRAKMGGGIAFMGVMSLGGEGVSQVHGNLASENGGGLFGFSSYARLNVASEHMLSIQDNVAHADGGGIGLDQGAQFLVSAPQCSPACTGAMRNNGFCDHGCLTAGCNWDDGECNHLFTRAGEDAVKTCDCEPYFHLVSTMISCNELVVGTFGCFTAACDWMPYGPVCEDTRALLRNCPLFDAVALHSVSSVPGLVYVKEGVGFTTPERYGSGDPFPFQPSQGVGRCLDAVCRADPPPISGIRELADGERWCDSIALYGTDQVVTTEPGGLSCAKDGDPIHYCPKVGKAWGVCSSRPRLPSFGQDYNPESLTRLLSLSQPQLFAEHKGCGILPVVVRNNRAEGFGGGLFQAGCDIGLERKGLCWVGGIAEKVASSYILSFEANTAGAAGGAVFTTCHSLGVCETVLRKTVGLPVLSEGGGTILSFLSNKAMGYGDDIASAPTGLVLSGTYATAYVPGQTSLDVSFSLLDGKGQIVGGTTEQPISHMVQILILSVSADCTTFASCERLKLQSTESFLSKGDAILTSLKEDFVAPPLRYCQIGVPDVLIRLYVISSAQLDAPADLPTLQKTIKVDCHPCEPGWTRQETSDGLWTCVRCDKKQYIIDPNANECQPCAVGAVCEDGKFQPVNPADSVWNSTADGVYRIAKCPPGFVLIRDQADPVSDRCVPCAPDTYSVEEAVFGERLWDRSVENYNQYCRPCPRSRAMCGGANDVRPLAGFWSPLNSNRDIGTKNRRQEDAETADTVNRGRSVTLYRCIPPTACLEGNASYPSGLCMPGAYGPLCGICNETDGYAKSKDGCRLCDASGTKQSTTEIAIWTGLLGVPVFLMFWYFFALRPLVTRGPDEQEEERPEKTSEAWNMLKARLFFCAGRVSEHPIWRRTMAPVIGPAQALMSNCIAYVVRNNPKDYIKIIVSFYQVSTAFSSNIDVKWPDSVTSVWKFFAFLTMEIFKLYGYDCMFGGINYLGRLALVTTVPMLVVFIFTVPWLASFFYQKHRQSLVFDTCANSVMWVIYLIYPLLCLMTIQGFKCVNVEDLHLLAADMNEPCPWKKGERGSWIFVWSVASMVLYPIGIPVILLACLLRLDLPRLSRYGKGEAIFQQLIGLYIKQRDESVCSRIATYVGGHKDASQPLVDLAERAAQLHREVSGNGEHAVTSEQFLNWLHQDVTDDDREEMEQIFAHFDDDGNGALDENEMLALLTFLIDANSRIHVGLTLRTIKTMDVKTMANHFLMDEGRECAQSSGLTRFFLKQLKQEADVVPVQRRASLLESSSFRSQGSSSRLSSSSLADAEQVADTDVTEKDKIIDSILYKGRNMIRQGVFALPKLAWNANEANPEEKRVLQMIGFLLDAYHKDAWWWELFEMWRKFMLAGAIILIPTEGGKQIAFALLISTICLYTSLRTSPYIIENLLKLHIMSLTAQCITLFYALLLEVQDVTSVAEVCEDGKTCNQQNISDHIMESLLSLLQVSVFVLPVVLLLRDRGVLDAVGNVFKRVVGEARKGARVCTGHTAVETKKVRWPSSVTHDDSASTSHLRSRKKRLDQPLETTYSSRKSTTARGAHLEAGAGVGGALGTTVRKQRRGNDVDAQTAGFQTPGNDEVMLTKVTETEELRRERDTLAAERSKMTGEYEKLTGILAQSPRARLSRLAQSTLYEPDVSMLSPKYDEGGNMQAPPSLPKLQEVWQNLNELDADINKEDKQTSSDRLKASVVTPQKDKMQLKTASNETIALSPSLDNALCSRGCEGDDAGAIYWCKNCDQTLCGPCAIRHTRSHVLCELAVLRAQQDVEDKLSRVRETSLEQRRHSKAQKEEIKREKQELSSQIKAEEEKRLLQLMKEAAIFRSKEEQRLRELDEDAAQINAAAEKEAQRIKAEEDELLVQKQRLEEELSSAPLSSMFNTTGFGHVGASITMSPPATHGQLAERLARLRAEEDELVHRLEEARVSEEEICRDSEKRLLHSFITEETIKTPLSHTGAAAASSASSTRPQRVQTPRQQVPTEKKERLGIETSPDVLESRREEDCITESSEPTGGFTLPLETIMMPISDTRVAAPAAFSASAPAPRSTGTETPERAVDLSPARSAQAGARERLKAARELFDDGLIDESDFKKAKADIVSTLSRVFQ